MDYYISLILIIPFLTFFCLFFFGRYLGVSGSAVVVAIFNFFLFVTCTTFFLKVLTTNILFIELNLGTWVFAKYEIASWSFVFDTLSVTMSWVVVSVSILVNLYSMNYMRQDPAIVKFLSYLSLFVFFMIVLITASNFVLLFLGWEGVGLCSYLLVGFWVTRVQASKAAFKALFMNRIGDFFIVLAVCVLIKYFKTTDFNLVFALIPYFKDVFLDTAFMKVSVVDAVSVLLILGAFGKSAQIGLHTWLPDAMEGPTPVSALIHAATMVTAGVFLVIRCAYLIDFSEKALFLMIVFGTLTAVMSGLIALGQWDLKKIIAFSTCSQLGYMFVMCGLSSYAPSFYHLTTHAFFKALLFLSSGYIIHLFSGEQDIRKMGSLVILSPFSYVLIFVASLSLMGVAGLSGFYSKEAILHSSFIRGGDSIFDWVLYFLLFFSIFLTTLYSMRLLYYVFYLDSSYLNKNQYAALSDSKFTDSSFLIRAAMVLLGVLTIFFGYALRYVFLPGSNFFSAAVYSSLKENSFYSEFVASDVDFFIFLAACFLFFVTVLERSFYFKKLDSLYSGSAFYKQVFVAYNVIFKFFNNKFYFDVLYNYVVKKFFVLFFFTFEAFEKGVLEVFGFEGVFRAVVKLGLGVRRLHSGHIHNYLNVMVFSLFFFIVLYYLFLLG